MHIFLQGPRRIGKSTVIRRTLDLLIYQRPLKLGGFYTWRDEVNGQHIYLRPAKTGREQEIYRLATYDVKAGRLCCDLQIFEQIGARLLDESAGADVILLDELGFLESDAPTFKQAVLAALSADTPVLGVLRQGDIPWQRAIKSDPRLLFYEVNEINRDNLPPQLAAQLAVQLK